MTINKTTEGSTLTISIEGRLDTITAPKADEEIRPSLTGVTNLILDLADLEYISSAGLRVLLSTQKIMNRQGSMVLHNVSSDIMDILEVTGFVDILTIE